MADRSYSYRFLGSFSNLSTGLAVAGRQVGELGTKLVTLDRQGAVARRGLTTMGATAGRAGLVAAAGFAVIERAAISFDQAMSNVAATGAATADQLGKLRDAALEAGQTTQFSATQAAGGIEALLKAGVSAQDVIGGGLKGSLDLAAAGQLDVADAAEIAATALTQFKLVGQDVPHVADLLAAGAGKAQGDVSDLSMALKQSGLVASQMGVSLEETVGTLSDFASAGLLGSDAGTSFRTMLLRLANPTQESAQLMQQLGIQAYDAQGNFVGIAALSDQLQAAFQGQTQATRDAALATLFGSDAIRAASVLYSSGGKGVRDWTDKVNDSGYAADVAATRMDNLAGDLHKFSSSLQTAFIGAGEGSQGGLRQLVQDATSAVNAFNKLPAPVQSTTTALLGLTAITGGGLWLGAKAVSSVTSLRQSLDDLSVSGSRSSVALSRLAKAGVALAALEGAGAIMQGIDQAAAGAAPNVERLTSALIAADNAKFADEFGDLQDDLDRIDPNGIDKVAHSLDELGAKGGFAGTALVRGLGSFAGLTTDMARTSIEVQKAAQAIDSLDQALAGLVTSGGPDRAQQAFDALVASQHLSKDQTEQLLKLLPEYQDALAGAGNEAALAAEDQQQYAGGVQDGADANENQTKAIRDAMDAMRDQRDVALSAFDAETRYRQAVKDAAAQAKKNNAGIKDSSDAALANRDALSRLADGWNSLDNKTKNAAGSYKAARQNFIDTAVGMGVSRKAAQDLADAVLQIPKSRETKISTPGIDDAQKKVDLLKRTMDALHSKSISITLNYLTGQNKPHAPLPGDPNEPPKRFGRSSSGLNLVTPRTSDLQAQAEAKSAYALGLLAKNSDEAAKGSKGLKEQLHDAEQRLERLSRAASDAHDALQKLKDDKDSLESSVIGSLEHDAFGGSLADFETQTAADTADAQAVLAALQQLVANGLDPHSQLFQRLAASGNVALIQQFAALSRSQLAAEAASFAAGQTALSAVGQFVGNEAFNDLIAAQRKVSDHLDATVHHLAQQVNQLQHTLDKMGDKVKQGAKEGTSDVGRLAEQGVRAGITDRDRRTHHRVRTGA